MRTLLVTLAVLLSGCGGSGFNPEEGCRGHGGVDPAVRQLERDNGGPDVAVCEDGTLVRLP